MKRFTRKTGVFYYLASQLLGTCASLITVVFMQLAQWEVFTPLKNKAAIAAYENIIEARYPVFEYLQFIAPFTATITAGLIYFSVFFRKSFYDQSQDKLLRRICNQPIFAMLATLFAWFLSAVIQTTGYFLIDFAMEDLIAIIISRVIIPLLTGALIGVLIYYLMEFLNQFWIIPRYFSSGRIIKEKKIIRISLRSRFFIFALSTAVLPFFFFFFMAVGTTERILPFILYGIFFGITALMTTLFITRIFREPLIRMDNAARSIQNGDYNQKLKVITSDELGRLSHTLNEMSKGLSERDYIKETFGKAVDPVIRDHLLKGNINLGGQYYDATVLFTDIRDFTTLSENLPADQLLTLLNRYFGAVTGAVIEEGGLVNKYIGDAVLALFGVPITRKDHAEQAVKAAANIIRRRDALNVQLRREGLPELKNGIGIHTGKLVAGNIGSDMRMEFTAIGDTVNVAARLETSSKQLKQDIVISESTVSQCKEIDGFRKLGKITLKGRSAPIRVYTVKQ